MSKQLALSSIVAIIAMASLAAMSTLHGNVTVSRDAAMSPIPAEASINL